MRLGPTLGALLVALTMSVGCVQSPTGPAFIFMDVMGPLGTANGKSTPKRGEACATVVLALFATGDASIEAAKRNGRIKEVTTIDHHSTNTLGFGKFCTIVYGQ